MNLDAEKMNELLRQVDVPADLIERLRELPEQRNVVVRRRMPWNFGAVASLAAAASIALIAIGSWWLGLLSPAVVERPRETAAVAPSTHENSSQPTVARDLRPELQAIRAELDDIQSTIDALEINDLRRRLAVGQQKSVLSLPDSRQAESLIASLAAQSAAEWGADPTTVNGEMMRILQQYPNSLGALRASEFLQLQ
jgi:hypothetical protein